MRRSSRLAQALLVIVGMLLSACGAPAQADVARSERPRQAEPQVAAEELRALVAGNNRFALDLYRSLAQQEGNLLFSPHSIAQALAMAYAGAHGDTAAQMAQVMHIDLADQRFHAAQNALDLALASRAQARPSVPDPQVAGFKLHVANSAWGQVNYRFQPAFLDTLAEHYGAGVRLHDFESDPEQGRVAINRWIGEQTEGKIPELIPPRVINDATRLVLANAIYFKAFWQHRFEKELTRDAPFTLLDGSTATVPMMVKGEEFRYAEGPGLQAVELPYEGGPSLVVLLPAAGQFQQFESELDAARLETMLAALQPRRTILRMPRFGYQPDPINLKQLLEGLGMRDAFEFGRADFSAMDGSRSLFLSAVLHQATITVDEDGTEASAATAAVVTAGSAPPTDIIELTIDRPFVFLIRDAETGALLFMGRVLKP